MTKPDTQRLADYVRLVADRLALMDWEFIVRIGEPEIALPWGLNQPVASIECVDGRKLAYLTFIESTRVQPAEEIRHTVVHELIHAHLNPACEIVRVDAKDGFSQATYELLMANFRRNVEFGVDGLADAIAPSLPLIEWPKAKEKR